MYHDPKAYHVAEIKEPNPDGWSTLCEYKLEPGKTNLNLEPGVYEEMKKMLDDVWMGNLAGRATFTARVKNKLFIVRQKIKMTTGINV